jgi:hypothetical protein
MLLFDMLCLTHKIQDRLGQQPTQMPFLFISHFSSIKSQITHQQFVVGIIRIHNFEVSSRAKHCR